VSARDIKDVSYDFSLMLRLADGSSIWVSGKHIDDGCEMSFQNGRGEPLDAEMEALARKRARLSLLCFLRKVQDV
jgi:hypothetical protein